MSNRIHIEPPNLDSLFGDDKASAPSSQITALPIEELHPFKDHPYRVDDNPQMQEMTDSVKEFGVLVPALVRPAPGGNGYEIVAGHRRRRACQLAGLRDMPCIIREMDDDTATITMVDSNIQREDILPSEKAKAFKMKMEALRHQGERTDISSRQFGEKRWAVTKVAEDSGDSPRQVHRFVRLTELAPDLLELVDSNNLAFNPAVELSYLQPQEQAKLSDLLRCEERAPSLSQAQQLKKMSQMGMLNEQVMMNVIAERKPQEACRIVLKEEMLRQYFPEDFTPCQMEEVVLQLLQGWKREQQRAKQQLER